MSDDGRLRDLMTRWQDGWVTVRGYHAEVAGDVVTVQIGQPDRVAERILLTADSDLFAGVAARTAGPGHWLTAPTADRARTEADACAAGFTVHAPEWLMSRPLDDHPVATAPDGYEALLSGRHPMLVAEVMAVGTEPRALAAKGHLALSCDGADAVPDRIFTVPAHRRRGLGTVVMSELTAAARDHGARTGLLVASGDGRKLYERLGWRIEAEMAVAHWTGHVPPADPIE